ncbi:Tim17/Tim22/Tim23/Pmp24 family-domain-containing protein [Sphaerosporella brunnea]|uniref:Mitochondrial import inner membrane translocase subunit TIM22 n=1 Tax=Sphaerosporella brunnea TaxID=1250544 RepID=A0A5J5EIB7_9PEZI|nr:Tim17/Tim22/Tim23/Pmp24 family-domain-containing protein [Sphaerosporella brunnea]
MSFGGFNPLTGRGPNGEAISADDLQQQKMMKLMQAGMESCPFKTVLSGGAGFALGGVFGLFMASMSYDTPLSGTQQLSSLPLRQQLKVGFKDMGARSWSSAKNFGLVGAIFSGTECCIEGFRAKNDIYNGIAAGCITGGALAAPAGPQAAAIGCAGFAAFSAAIDYYLRMD